MQSSNELFNKIWCKYLVFVSCLVFIFCLIFFVSFKWNETYSKALEMENSVSVVLNPDDTLPLIFEYSSAQTASPTTPISTEFYWEKVYGGAGYQAPYSVIASKDGGAFIGGHITNSANNERVMYLMRIDKHGDQAWAKKYKTERDSRIHAMTTLSNGELLLAGGTATADKYVTNAHLVRINIEGQVVWEKTIENSENETASIVAPLPDGGAWILSDLGAVTRSISVRKIGSDGSVRINEIVEKDFNQTANSALPLIDGGLLIGGAANDFEQGRLSDIYYARLTSDVSVVWEEHLTIPVRERGVSRIYADVPIDDNNAYLLGVVDTTTDNGQDVFISRLTAEGEIIWRRRYGGEANDSAFAGVLTPSGGVLVGGQASYGYGTPQFQYLLCVNAQGNQIWDQEFGRTRHGRVTGMAMATDGHPIIVGFEHNGDSEENNWYVSKLKRECP